MPSLKEVKNRISSVNSTRKITSAMKMVASAKLHGAQKAIESMRPYESLLNRIMATFVSSMEGEINSPFSAEREVKRVAIVVYSSNTSLCGAFNGNVIKELTRIVEEYRNKGVEIAAIYPFGKKGADAARKLGFKVTDYDSIVEHPAYVPAAEVAADLMQKFAAEEIDHVEMIYHHFHSVGKQILTQETFLPVKLEANTEEVSGTHLDYIVEPSQETLISELIPKALHLKLYTALLDSLASEHAARVIAMQVATDNADELLRELTLQYNKSRQYAITAELLDIVGGSMQ